MACHLILNTLPLLKKGRGRISSHTHAPDPVRCQMLLGYQLAKDRALVSEDKTRTILTQGLVGLSQSSIVVLVFQFG